MDTKPSVEEIVRLVETHDKRIGLRMLYAKYKISEGERYKYRKLWNSFHEMLPTAFEKDEEADASEIRKTKKNDGDSGTPSGEAVQAEPECS
jgi:hypothetical protein